MSNNELRHRFVSSGLREVTDPAVLESLPTQPPEIPFLEFSKEGGGWPPSPHSDTNLTPFQSDVIPGSLTDDLEQEACSLALQDSKVMKLLGKDFAYIGSTSSFASKRGRVNTNQPIEVYLTFFSHSNNAAVQVTVKGNSVLEAAKINGSQPPEGQEEVIEAISLARTDDYLKDKVQNLDANAILLPLSKEEAGYNHRIIWVIFMESGEDEREKPALFTALVDINTRSVLTTRQEPPVHDQ